MKTWPKKHFWEYGTRSPHVFDWTVRFLLRPVMLTKAHGKISHWWHWQRVPKDEFTSLKETPLQGDPQAFSLKTYMALQSGYVGLDTVRLSLGGWKSGYVITPEKDVESWQFAFPDFRSKTHLLVCSLILEGPVRILRGPGDYMAYGIDQNNHGIKLVASAPIQRDDPSIPWPLI